MSKKPDASSLERTMKIDASKIFGSEADFEMRFYEEVLTLDPDNAEAMTNLAQIYTHKGLYAKGLALDVKLTFLESENPTAFYNLACSYSLLERSDEAFEALERAAMLGWSDWRLMRSDSDLSGLRRDPRFAALLKRLKRS